MSSNLLVSSLYFYAHQAAGICVAKFVPTEQDVEGEEEQVYEEEEDPGPAVSNSEAYSVVHPTPLVLDRPPALTHAHVHNGTYAVTYVCTTSKSVPNSRLPVELQILGHASSGSKCESHRHVLFFFSKVDSVSKYNKNWWHIHRS